MDSLTDLLAGESAREPLVVYVLNLFLAALLGYVLGKVYSRYGNTLSHRSRFASNFVLIAVTTNIIITVVKSSLALSLGLVGALSIVRFRAAIKQPEELAYLFLVIAVGLGTGASQPAVTVIGFIVAVIAIRIGSMSRASEESQSLFLTIADKTPKGVTVDAIVDVLKKRCSAVNLRRFDESADGLEASFMIEVDKFEQLNQAKVEAQQLSDTMEVTFLDNRGAL